MRLILLILALFSSQINHDIQVAYFKIYSDLDALIIEVNFEIEDLTGELSASQSEIDLYILKSYLDKNFNLKINGIEAILNVVGYSIKAKHLKLNCRVDSIQKNISHLEINNTCLLAIKNHSNVIDIILNNKERSFLMNEERTEISVNFN